MQPAVVLAIKYAPDVEKAINQAKEALNDIVKTEKSKKVTFTFACAYKDIRVDSVRDMDDELKIIIASTTKQLNQADGKDLSWDEITSILAQNPTIEPLGEPVFRTDIMKKSSTTFFGNGYTDTAVMNEVDTWYKKLVGDEDILKTSKMDIDFLKKIVAATGIVATSLLNSIAGYETKEHTLVDIGIIRYPDIDNPYFKIYRMQLKAWASIVKIVGIDNAQTGIHGEIAIRKYKPRAEIIASLKTETKKKAVQEAESLFA